MGFKFQDFALLFEFAVQSRVQSVPNFIMSSSSVSLFHLCSAVDITVALCCPLCPITPTLLLLSQIELPSGRLHTKQWSDCSPLSCLSGATVRVLSGATAFLIPGVSACASVILA